MKRIILIVGSTETLEYFSLQLAKSYLDAGREVFLWDMGHPSASIEAFEKLGDPGNSVLITFNFIGLCAEGQFGVGLSSIWDEFDIRKICILVDSPVYYYRQLSSGIENMKLVCIDRYHTEFLQENYPEYGEVTFMPLAGNVPVCDLWRKPGIITPDNIGFFNMGSGTSQGMETFESWKERRLDTLFIGNYVPLEDLQPSLARLGPEYKEFIIDIANDLLEHPAVPLEKMLMKRLTEEFPDSTHDEYMMACYQMVYIDLYVRNVYRGKIVTALADSGIKVFCTGKDWDKAPCKHPENLIHTGESVISLQCLQALSQAKVSINMMPWFKAGAHDRVFSSMLQGCALLSDSSEYLDTVITPGVDYEAFPLLSADETAARAASLAQALLTDQERAYEIACAGHRTAESGHLWSHRARVLESLT